MNDKKYHEAFKADAYFTPPPTAVRCRNCGTKLKVYYAEESLYAVKCCYCETITLAKARNPVEAARYVGEYVIDINVCDKWTNEGEVKWPKETQNESG